MMPSQRPRAALILKLEDLFLDLEKSKPQDINFHYAYIKGFLSALFELPEFTQTELEDFHEKLDSICRSLENA